ncbi:alpha/beta-hydrolase [Macroventuria anomochaeta]|uniref:Alpha/beta-hydrolase n=1 Tax=Macroventuria anomochaeta TaxID=301207 RepID=A0ACB6RTK5_9PLEO|nr:alpha/beta-hydrolase [Macroventuria anomochaeta]KAF2624464.1 alpha/beta-hydrolase [Macroventuria anomochaeta]
MSKLINTNDNEFIGVSIQYRLGAFGFLAGDEVFRHGVVNAGLLDQQFALQWIQRRIYCFGGDPRRVTIWGVSAGGSSVMLHNIAYGGTLGTSLFSNSTSSSPYLPQQYSYTDWVPSQSYYAFTARAGCFTPWGVWQQFSNHLSVSCFERYNRFAGSFSSGLQVRKIRNAAEEGFSFVPQNIRTEADLHAWIFLVFPLFASEDVAKLLYHYPSSSPIFPNLATSGTRCPTALDTSATASGLQQTANLIYSESTFICPSYWLAKAYSSYRAGGYKFQTSTPIALHGLDDLAVFGNRELLSQGRDYLHAVQRIWGNSIRTGNPSSRSAITKGESSSNLKASYRLENWPVYSFPESKMMNLNHTGGLVVPVNKTLNAVPNQVNATWSVEPGLKNDFSVVDAAVSLTSFTLILNLRFGERRVAIR